MLRCARRAPFRGRAPPFSEPSTPGAPSAYDALIVRASDVGCPAAAAGAFAEVERHNARQDARSAAHGERLAVEVAKVAALEETAMKQVEESSTKLREVEEALRAAGKGARHLGLGARPEGGVALP